MPPATAERGLARLGVSKGCPPELDASLDQTPPEKRTKGFSATVWITRRSDELAGAALRLDEFKGSLARVSNECDIYLPLVFSDRSWVIDPDLYFVCSELPRHTSFRYGLTKMPITEVTYAKTDGRIKSLANIFLLLEQVESNYQGRAASLKAARGLAMVAKTATDNLGRGAHGGPERFCEQAGQLYDQVVELVWVAYSGKDERKAVILEKRLERDKKRLVKRARKKEGLKNPTNLNKMTTILLGLEKEIDQIKRRQIEAEFISQKMGETRTRLSNQAADDRRAIRGLDKEMAEGSDISGCFEAPEKIAGNSSFLLGRLGTRIHLFERVRLRPYKEVAEWMLGELRNIREKVGERDYAGAQAEYQKFKADLEAKKAAAQKTQ